MPGKDQLTRIVQPLRGGQITIPAEFRRRLGITPQTMLQITMEGQDLRIHPLHLHPTETVGGSAWFAALHAEFAPVREEAGLYSEAEIDAAIDQAVSAVRHAERA